jgi:hypothetical protein
MLVLFLVQNTNQGYQLASGSKIIGKFPTFGELRSCLDAREGLES